MARGKNKRARTGALAIVNPQAPTLVNPENLPAIPTAGRLGRMFAEAAEFRTTGAAEMEANWNRMGQAMRRTRTIIAAAADRAEFTEQEVTGLVLREGLLTEDDLPPK